MTAPIPLLEPSFDGNEAQYLEECIASGYVSSVGPFVERFESAFADWVGARLAVACASGTAALHVALRLAGARPGSEVAVSTFTFLASVNAIQYTGATPLLVDSERDTWNLDAEQLHDEVDRRAALGRPLPSAIEVVHVLGHPADLEPVLDLSERYGIVLVEDACESLGASYVAGSAAGRQVGTVGALGCFSFNGNKVLTCGAGGMIVTNDPEYARRARHLTTQARVAGPQYLHDEVGYNYRLTNLAAAVGLAQLEQLDGFLARKRQIAARYGDALGGLPVERSPRAEWADPSCWLSSVLVEAGVDVELVIDRMGQAGVEARPLWLPAHEQPPYRGRVPTLGGAVAASLHERGLALPSSVGLTLGDQTRVVDALSHALALASA